MLHLPHTLDLPSSSNLASPACSTGCSTLVSPSQGVCASQNAVSARDKFCCAGAVTNSNGATSPSNTITNNNNNSGGTTNNNNNGGGTILPPAPPGQTPAPGTYNVITTTTDCNGQVDVQYSYVPGLRGISRNNNNNCG